MNLLVIILLILAAIASHGCVPNRSHEVKVLTSTTEVKIQTFDLQTKDVIVCDKDRCKVVEP